MLRLLFAVALGTAALVSLELSHFDDRFPSPSYVAHEWGTFTWMQGSDGVTLEGLQHEEEGLPDFVYSRSKVRACPLREFGYKGLEVEVRNVTKKMETPVVYFYAAKPLHVRARVSFEQGLLTQWYPVSDLLGPPELRREDGPLDMASVERSFLEWGVEVQAPGAGLKDLRPCAAGSPWDAQRIPDSNVVRTDARQSPRMGPQEQEKFLFYRGLGRFELPLAARASDRAHVSIENRGVEPVKHLFLVNVRNGIAAWSYAPELTAGKTLALGAELTPRASSVEAMIAELRPALEAKLVETGLYPKEAEAMTRTWERSYFHTEGLRVLYVVPTAQVERVLPLTLEPAPKELVRVLVGRLECMTPEEETAVIGAVRDWSSADPAARATAVALLEKLGRFVEPHVRRVLALCSEEAVLANARAILELIAEGADVGQAAAEVLPGSGR